MAGQPVHGERTRILIVEDLIAQAQPLAERLRRLRGPAGESVETKVTDHHVFLDDPGRLDGWVDVAFVDAYRAPSVGGEGLARSMFAGPEVAELLGSLTPAPRVIGYSGAAERPEVNITFREIGCVAAVYDSAVLVEHLAEAIWSDTYEHQVAPPTAVDYDFLGLLPGARIWEALRYVKDRPELWSCMTRSGHYQAVPAYARYVMRTHVAPLLPMARAGSSTDGPDEARSQPTVRELIPVLRRVANI